MHSKQCAMCFGKSTQNRTITTQNNYIQPTARLFGREKIMLTPSTAKYLLKGNNTAIYQDWASLKLAMQFVWLMLNTPIEF
jgi:hypothetical protein